jgi:aspartate/glutamate racemase
MPLPAVKTLGLLGCTEIMLLISAADNPLPVFDTTAWYAQAAVNGMFSASVR